MVPPCHLCRNFVLTFFLLWNSLNVYAFTITTTSTPKRPSFIGTKISNNYGRPSNVVLKAAAKKKTEEKNEGNVINDNDAQNIKKQKSTMTDSVNGVVVDIKKESNNKAKSSASIPTNITSFNEDGEEEKEEMIDDEQTILDKEMMRKAIQMAQSRWVCSFVGKIIE